MPPIDALARTLSQARGRRTFLRALIVLCALLCCAYPAAAQSTTTLSMQISGAEGVLDGSAREFQVSELDDGTIYLSFAVIEFDSVAHAEDGIDPFVDATLATLTAGGFILSSFPTVAPDVRESTLAYEGKTMIEGHTLDTALLVFRDGRYLHMWTAWGQGFAPNPLLDLATIAERFYQDRLPLYERDGVSRPLDLVPTLSDIPPGFVLSHETEDLASEWENASAG